jgi:hypothetical protein
MQQAYKKVGVNKMGNGRRDGDGVAGRDLLQGAIRSGPIRPASFEFVRATQVGLSFAGGAHDGL